MATQCPSCDYDLSGVTSKVCPECGTPVPKAGTGVREDALTRLALAMIGWGWVGMIAGRAIGSSYAYIPHEGTYNGGGTAARILQTPALLIVAAGAGMLAYLHGRTWPTRWWPGIAACAAGVFIIASVTGWQLPAAPDAARWMQPLSWKLGGDLALGLAIAVLALVSALALRRFTTRFVGGVPRRLASVFVVGAFAFLLMVPVAEALELHAAPSQPVYPPMPARAAPTPPPPPTYFQTWYGQRLPPAVLSLTRYGVTAGIGLLALVLRALWIADHRPVSRPRD